MAGLSPSGLPFNGVAAATVSTGQLFRISGNRFNGYAQGESQCPIKRGI